MRPESNLQGRAPPDRALGLRTCAPPPAPAPAAPSRPADLAHRLGIARARLCRAANRARQRGENRANLLRAAAWLEAQRARAQQRRQACAAGARGARVGGADRAQASGLSPITDQRAPQAPMHTQAAMVSAPCAARRERLSLPRCRAGGSLAAASPRAPARSSTRRPAADALTLEDLRALIALGRTSWRSLARRLGAHAPARTRHPLDLTLPPGHEAHHRASGERRQLQHCVDAPPRSPMAAISAPAGSLSSPLAAPLPPRRGRGGRASGRGRERRHPDARERGRGSTAGALPENCRMDCRACEKSSRDLRGGRRFPPLLLTVSCSDRQLVAAAARKLAITMETEETGGASGANGGTNGHQQQQDSGAGVCARWGLCSAWGRAQLEGGGPCAPAPLRARACTTPRRRCQAPAKLQCPKCLELKLPKASSVFCSQDCFKVIAARSASQPPPTHTCSLRAARLHARVRRSASPPRPPRPALRDAEQAAWGEHKKVHQPAPDAWLYCIKRGRGRSLVMPEFDWTGPLRPGKISPMREVRPPPPLRWRLRLATVPKRAP